MLILKFYIFIEFKFCNYHFRKFFHVQKKCSEILPYNFGPNLCDKK